ncbi:MAG: response regulator [Deltaproteobacteria bacterium]|jgi:signal transduction histidine kinase/CheY-like chemotaxis protein/ABC-type amino acid transport substrate-binding protein|nr:response regulator [Deltaproteobacteria bacterium]
MAGKLSGRLRLVLITALIPLLFASCVEREEGGSREELVQGYIRDFRTIPGVTESEINAVLSFQARELSFSFGTQPSPEAFEDAEGRKSGFLIAFADFLSELLGLQFKPTFYERGILREALETGWLDFSCEAEWPENDARRPHFATDPIYVRAVKVFKLRGTDDLRAIARQRPVKYGFLAGAGIEEKVLDATKFQVETFVFGTLEEAAAKLLAGEIDAFFEESGAYSYFESLEGIVSEDYFPPIELPLSLGTANAEYRPIISVVQKFLEAGGFEYLSGLYTRSAVLNRRFLFEKSLTREEKEWLSARIKFAGPVLVAAEPDDYPVSFYNSKTREFQGIAHDILSDISEISGLKFQIANDPSVGTAELERMVSYGEAQILANYNFMEDVGGYLIVPRPHSYDRYALLANIDSNEIRFNEIFYGTVGLVRGDRKSDLYRKWFPNSRNVVYYPTMERALQALRRRNVMYVMGSTNLLLSRTNYMEDPGFKAGLVFDYQVPFGFALNQDEEELRAVFDKAMVLSGVDQADERWNTRMFDYNQKFLRDLIPYFAVFLCLILLILLGLLYENRKNRRLNRNLESLVDERTAKLLAAQVDLERERQLFQRILESCPICFTITVDGNIAFLTPFAENFLGKKKGETLMDRFAVKEELEEALTRLRGGEVLNWRPMKIARGDGEVREVLVNSFVSDYYGDKGIMSWFTDVTELRENARDLALARDIAEDSARAKSEFLANMSHEIRTPMNAIVGVTQLTLQTDLSDTQRDYLTMIQQAAKSLLGIINDILDFSKIEAGKLTMERIPFNLEEVVDNAVNLSQVRANEKNLELILEISPSVPTSLVGDPMRLGQVMNNLLSNAVKFTERGRVVLKISILQETEGQVILKFAIQDTGIGLTREQISRLFTAFNQADSSVTRRFGGSGLGLAISKRLVEMMGGNIWCEGKAGEGSTFSFTGIFGVRDADKRYATSREDFKGLLALAVDDSPPALTVIAGELESLGLTVLTAESGALAVKILKEKAAGPKAVDLVFLDWKMPEMSGAETAAAIKRELPQDKQPALIIVTALDRDEVAMEAKDVGARVILSKPVMVSSLLNALNDTLASLPKRLRKSRPREEMDASSVSHLKGSSILLVEDNEVNQLVARKLLKNAGFVVDIAGNGRQAFEKVLANKYDLVLMDIQMPEMDGLTSTKAIRALPGYEALPIVAMTAHAMSGDREMSLAAGMNDHITKPIILNDLFAALNRWIKKPTGSEAEAPAAPAEA